MSHSPAAGDNLVTTPQRCFHCNKESARSFYCCVDQLVIRGGKKGCALRRRIETELKIFHYIIHITTQLMIMNWITALTVANFKLQTVMEKML
jgi:hypothetical protein